METQKCVMVIDERLPPGLIANTAAILGITLGKRRPEAVGADVYDASGLVHLGIVEFPVPILKGTAETIRALRERLYEPESAGLIAVDFSKLAQGCRTYGEFVEKMAAVPERELAYLGIALCGPRKQVDRLTGSISLLR